MPKKKTNGSVGKTHIAVILDKSGSMASVRVETISGFNDYLATLRGDPRAEEMALTLTLFDTTFQTPIVATPPSQVNDLDDTRYVPSGYTALYDAIRQTASQMEASVGKDDRALVVIITDGQENSSRDTTKAQVLDLIQEREKRGNWTFTYLSASPAAFTDAQGIGVAAGNVAAYTATRTGTRAAFAGMARGTSAFAKSTLRADSAFYSRAVGNVIPDPVAPVADPSAGWVSATAKPTGKSGATTPWTK